MLVKRSSQNVLSTMYNLIITYACYIFFFSFCILSFCIFVSFLFVHNDCAPRNRHNFNEVTNFIVLSFASNGNLEYDDEYSIHDVTIYSDVVAVTYVSTHWLI